MSAASLEKASLDSPWNERVQSTCRAPSSRIMGSSLRPLARSANSGDVELEVWGADGGGAVVVRAVAGVFERCDCAEALVAYCALWA